jgi:hypothetical protein
MVDLATEQLGTIYGLFINHAFTQSEKFCKKPENNFRTFLIMIIYVFQINNK